MEKLWTFLMQTNAKALFVLALVVLFGVSLWRGWVEIAAASRPVPDEPVIGRAQFKPGKDLGLIAFASNQLAAVHEIPVNPFRPTLESLAANPATLAAISKGEWPPSLPTTNKPPKIPGTNVFAHVRLPPTNVTGAASAPPVVTPPIVTPRLTFTGFFKRPDGRTLAQFHDSVSNDSVFTRPGDALRGA
ncbi:MAG: hypothetical protein WCG22_06040, partial [Lentisphaerota bacterium]